MSVVKSVVNGLNNSGCTKSWQNTQHVVGLKYEHGWTDAYIYIYIYVYIAYINILIYW